MAVEDRYIPAGQRTTIDDGDLSILIFYQPAGFLNLIFFVPLVDTRREGVSFVAGDLGYSFSNITAMFEITTTGDLIVNDINPTLYSINAAGDLILTIT